MYEYQTKCMVERRNYVKSNRKRQHSEIPVINIDFPFGLSFEDTRRYAELLYDPNLSHDYLKGFINILHQCPRGEECVLVLTAN